MWCRLRGDPIPCPRTDRATHIPSPHPRARPAVTAFLGGVLRGGISTRPVGRFGAVEPLEGWDGKDGELPEETPLDAYDDVEIDF